MKNKGFTLIEVLIVVIIIGILATLMMPQIGGMMERARVAEAKQILGAIRTTLMVYYMERTTFPTTAAANTAAVESVIGKMVDDSKTLFTYSWTAGTATDITVTATRVGTNTPITGGKTAKVTQKIYATGGADIPQVTWE